MYTKRDVVIFFAGFAAFHTLSHLIMGLSRELPITLFSITLTKQHNLWAVILSTAITIWLLVWASRLKK
ncbi:MAG: hypothetical protein Q8Q25_00790 [bacterium]|nr:hypothetical protein [bacterium]